MFAMDLFNDQFNRLIEGFLEGNLSDTQATLLEKMLLDLDPSQLKYILDNTVLSGLFEDKQLSLMQKEELFERINKNL